jgi:hypothetical protein
MLKKNFTMVFQMLLCGECKIFTLKDVQAIHRSTPCTALFETPCITSGSRIEP